MLNRAARERGITQAQLGEAADVSQSQLSKILRGERQMSIDQLAAMCRVLGLGFLDVAREAERVAIARAEARGQHPMDVYLAERATLDEATPEPSKGNGE